MPAMPIKLNSGTTFGPVALLCGLVALLGFLAAFLLLVFYADPQRVSFFVTPLTPAISTVAAMALLWWKQHSSQKLNTQQNEFLANQVQSTQDTVATRLNGELDGRMRDAAQAAVVDGVNQLRDELTTAAVSVAANPARLSAALEQARTTTAVQNTDHPPAHAATPDPAPNVVPLLPEEIPHG